MDTIRQFEGAMADGGLGAVARALVEACVNEVMSAQADALREETGTSRNGFRERRLETQVGAITLGIPKLREGTCFPGGDRRALEPRRPRPIEDHRARGA